MTTAVREGSHRNAFSTTFNSGMQTVLAGYAANGVIVNYLDLTLIGQQIVANPGAYGLTSAGACAPAIQCITSAAYTNQFLSIASLIQSSEQIEGPNRHIHQYV